MEDNKGSSLKKVDDHEQRKSNRGRPKKYEEGQVRHSVSWGKKEDSVWEDASQLARTEQTSISQIVLRSLQEYTRRHLPGNPQTPIETFEEGDIPESLKQKYPEKIISILKGFPKDKLQLLKKGVEDLLQKKRENSLQKKEERAAKEAKEIYQESKEHAEAAERLIKKGKFDRAEEEAEQVIIPSSKRKELLKEIAEEREKLKEREQKREGPDYSLEDIEVDVDYPSQPEHSRPREEQRERIREQRQTVKKWREMIKWLREHSSNFSLDVRISRDQLRTVISQVSARGDPPATQETVNKYFDLITKYDLVRAADDVGATWEITDLGRRLLKEKELMEGEGG